MKRMVCVLAVVVMLVGMAGMAVSETNRAEQAEKIENYCKKMMKSLYNTYVEKGKLSESNIFMAYYYYKTYKAAMYLKLVEMGVYIGDIDTVKKTLSAKADLPDIDDLMEEQWINYLKGETDADTFTYLIMNVSIKVALNDD